MDHPGGHHRLPKGVGILCTLALKRLELIRYRSKTWLETRLRETPKARPSVGWHLLTKALSKRVGCLEACRLGDEAILERLDGTPRIYPCLQMCYRLDGHWRLILLNGVEEVDEVRIWTLGSLWCCCCCCCCWF